MRRLALFAAFGLTSSIQLAVAHAAPAPRVSLRLVECSDVAATEVRRITALELKMPVSSDTEASAGETSVTIRCSATHADLSLVDRLTAKSLQRSIDISTTPALARPRLLALSVAELVSASWAELSLSHASTPPSLRAEGSVRRARETVRGRTVGLEGQVVALGGARRWSSAWTSFGPGLRLQLGYPLSPRWALWATSGAFVERGSVEEAAGRVTLTVFDGALAGLVAARWESLSVAGGVGLRGGLLQAAGDAREPKRVAGRVAHDGYAATMIMLTGSWSPSAPLCLFAGVESGLSFRPVMVRVLGEPTAGADRAWVGGSLGLGVVL